MPGIDNNQIANLAGPEPATDGFTKNTASQYGFGFHTGFLYEFTEKTRIGLSYRSQIKVGLKGNSSTLIPGFPLLHQEIRSNIILSAMATVSAYHDLNNRLAVMADVSWMHWSKFNQIVLNFDNGSQLNIQEQYKNTLRRVF